MSNAQDLLKSTLSISEFGHIMWTETEIVKAMKEFAKIHVQAALEVAAQKAAQEEGREFDYLLKCYPDERIQ